jgi:hypothetical protein
MVTNPDTEFTNRALSNVSDASISFPCFFIIVGMFGGTMGTSNDGLCIVKLVLEHVNAMTKKKSLQGVDVTHKGLPYNLEVLVINLTTAE